MHRLEWGGRVLDRAFEDLGVLVVDYQQAHGRGFSFDHGLGDFLREFDAGRYPGLMVPVSESATRSRLAGSVLSLTDKAEHLTQEQKARLEAELAELEGPKRAEIVEAIKTARSFGDLSENFEYHAAKNEQGLLERRITILRDRLQRAEIVDEKAAAASSEVSVGSRVSLELEDGETMEVEITSVDGVSPESPLGQALLGAKVGDEVIVAAPRGEWRAKILSVGR